MDDDVCPQVVGWRAMQPIHRGRAQHVDVEEAVDTLHGSASGAMAGTMKTEKKEGSWDMLGGSRKIAVVDRCVGVGVRVVVVVVVAAAAAAANIDA